MSVNEKTKDAPDFQDVEHGPINNNQRQCRDVLCCIIFCANIVALIVFAIWGYSQGDPSQAYRATDNAKNVCGQTGTTTESFRFAYFFNPTDLGNRVCVKECPYYENGTLRTLECISGVDCTYDVIVNQDGTVSSFSSTDFVGYGSSSSLDRICLPKLVVLENAFKEYSTSLANGLDESYLADFVTDVQNNWQYILAGFGFAVGLAFIMMFLLRWFAGILVWVSVFGIIAIFILGGLIFLYNAGTFGSYGDQLGNLGIPTLQPDEYYNVYGGICFGVALLLLLILLCCCSRIRLAVAVCKVAGRFILRVAQVMLVPIFMTFFIVGLWAFSLTAMLYIISRATFIANGDIFTSLQSLTQSTLGMFYYFIFGTLWANAFLGAITIFVIASCCCMWYFSQGPDDSLDSPVLKSYWRIFRFHMGSLAFGALILAIIQFIEIIVQAIKSRTVDQTGNACMKCAVRCLQCCLKCLQRIVEYLNQQAYIQIALRGKNFCMASYDGVCAILSNPLRYGIVSGVGSILMFITQLLISAGATALFYVLITFADSIRNNVLEPIFLLIVVFLGSYIIAVVFMSVYSVAMDTILACFIADQQNQKGKSGNPLYAPAELVDLMDK